MSILSNAVLTVVASGILPAHTAAKGMPAKDFLALVQAECPASFRDKVTSAQVTAAVRQINMEREAEGLGLLCSSRQGPGGGWRAGGVARVEGDSSEEQSVQQVASNLAAKPVKRSPGGAVISDPLRESAAHAFSKFCYAFLCREFNGEAVTPERLSEVKQAIGTLVSERFELCYEDFAKNPFAPVLKPRKTKASATGDSADDTSDSDDDSDDDDSSDDDASLSE